MSARVLVIGGGPAGLAAAIELRRRGTEDVVVLEREAEPGGIPRHAAHQGFGARDLHRLMGGPAYARRYAELARRTGVELVTETMATGWTAGGPLEVTGPGGPETLAPDGVVLASGCRERPRAARLVPGSRPLGVMTTGMLQQLVHVARRRPGDRALIVGAEHVSFSAIATLAHGGARALGMTTELDRHQSLALFRVGAALCYRIPLWTRTRVAAIHGASRVERVELVDLDTGARTQVACDTVVFTADRIPDHELAAKAGMELARQTRGPAVDTALRKSRRGVFAAGNVLRGAETADVAALEGRHAAASLADYLADGVWPEPRVPISCQPPLGWIAPNAVTTPAEPPPRGGFLLRGRAFMRRAGVEVQQGSRLLWRGRLRRLRPRRSSRLPGDWTAKVDPAGGEISVALASPP